MTPDQFEAWLALEGWYFCHGDLWRGIQNDVKKVNWLLLNQDICRGSYERGAVRPDVCVVPWRYDQIIRAIEGKES